MDTRRKILSPAAALSLDGAHLIVVTGYFDVLRADHARDLGQIREWAQVALGPSGGLLAIVLPLADAVLPAAARAEMVAALRVVDYVVTAESGDPERLIEGLKPADLVRLEASDRRRRRELSEHVQGRQSSE